MGAKRALIVDDSKSARLFLARILEKYEIDVDNAENAESAEADTAASTRFLSPIVRPSSRRSSSRSDATTSRSMPLSRKIASSRDRPKRASHL